MTTIYAKNSKINRAHAKSEGRISIKLSSSDIDAINWAIATLAAKLQPFLIALDEEDKNNLAKLGERSILFIEMCLQSAESDAEFLPDFIDVAKMKQDLTAFSLLSEFLRPLRQITRNLDDTATLCGSEVISASLAYYNSVTHAVEMNAPNASVIHDDLSQLFEAQKPRTHQPEAIE
jgi:hypothetical protein